MVPVEEKGVLDLLRANAIAANVDHLV